MPEVQQSVTSILSQIDLHGQALWYKTVNTRLILTFWTEFFNLCEYEIKLCFLDNSSQCSQRYFISESLSIIGAIFLQVFCNDLHVGNCLIVNVALNLSNWLIGHDKW